MASCGDTTATKDDIMPKKARFDRSTQCIKCKTTRGNIVIRHAVYCKACFEPFVLTKFRRCLDPTINASPTGRKKALKASGNVMVGHSGGLGSAILLDILTRIYLSRGTINGTTEKGGSSHPRNEPVWKTAYICHVDVSETLPESEKYSHDDIQSLHQHQCPDIQFLSVRLEDAFDWKWWRSINHSLINDTEHASLSLDGEMARLNIMPSSTDPREALNSYLSTLPTPTAVQHTVAMLIRLLLTHKSISLGCSHLLLGTSLTSLSISLIDSIAQGGGFNLAKETYDEIMPSRADAKLSLRIVRPLHDVGMKECAAWFHWHGLTVARRSISNGSPNKQIIHDLTKTFIIGLERDYPSTVSTIVRTCAKVSARGDVSGTCILCLRPVQAGSQDWKSHISIRSSDPRTPPTDLPQPPDASSELCYSCHTTLTSRSPRSQLTQNSPLPLPTWSSSLLLKEQRSRTALSRDDIEESLAEYFL